MNDSVQLPTFTVRLTNPALKADDPENASLIGTPVNVTVPTRDGGESTGTGTLVEIGDGYMVVEFLA